MIVVFVKRVNPNNGFLNKMKMNNTPVSKTTPRVRYKAFEDKSGDLEIEMNHK